MNFKRLETKKQYEFTKRQVETFEKEIKRTHDEIVFKLLQQNQICFIKDILQAEVGEYETRKQKEKDNIIDVEEIFEIQKFRKRINSLPLEKITFCYKGQKIRVDNVAIKDWELTGLTIIDFVNSYEKDIKKNLKAGRIKDKPGN